MTNGNHLIYSTLFGDQKAKEQERINPGVVIDGQHVEVPGYLWVLGFALAGVAWAIEEASKPETEALINKFLARQRMAKRQEYINDLEKRLAEAKARQAKDAL